MKIVPVVALQLMTLSASMAQQPVNSLFNQMRYQVEQFHKQMAQELASLQQQFDSFAAEMPQLSKRETQTAVFTIDETPDEVKIVLTAAIEEGKKVEAKQEGELLVLTIPVKDGSIALHVSSQFVVVSIEHEDKEEKQNADGHMQAVSVGYSSSSQTKSIPAVTVSRAKVQSLAKEGKIVVTLPKLIAASIAVEEA